MAQRRRRHLRRNGLIFLGSLIAHIGVFFLAMNDTALFPLPQETETAVQVEIVPQTALPIPPPIPLPRRQAAPAEEAPPAAPVTTPQPQPPTPQRAAPQPVAPAAPAPVAPNPTPSPVAKPMPAPAPAPQPAPSVTLSQPQVTQTAPKAHPAPKLVLHKSRGEASPLAPAISIPGAVFAPPAQAGGPPAGAPGGHGLAGLPAGALPGFGGALRSGRLGCANAEVMHLSAEEKARCAEAFGENALDTPRIDPIGATRRAELGAEATKEDAGEKYRDSTPSQSDVTPEAGQPRLRDLLSHH